MEEQKKCSHATCSCPALPLQEFCGDECKKMAAREAAGEEEMGRCHCQHPDCGGEPEIPAETQGLLMASEVLAAS